MVSVLINGLMIIVLLLFHTETSNEKPAKKLRELLFLWHFKNSPGHGQLPGALWSHSLDKTYYVSFL
jgi:hypothetical protein